MPDPKTGDAIASAETFAATAEGNGQSPPTTDLATLSESQLADLNPEELEGILTGNGTDTGGDGTQLQTGTATNGTDGTQQPDPAAAAAAAGAGGQAPPAGQDAGGDKPPPIMIPKDRLDAVLEDNRKLREQLAYTAGRADQAATAGGANGTGTGGTTQHDPAAELTQVDTQIKDLRQKYSEGEITFAEYEEQADTLKDRKAELKDEIRNAPRRAEEAILANPQLQAATNRLETENPWLAAVPDRIIQSSLLPLAHDLLAEKGVQLRDDPRSTFLLRAAVVTAGKMLGLHERTAAGGAPSGGNGTSPPPPPPPPAGPTAEDRRGKLALAGQHPPPISAAGTGAVADPYSNENLEKLSEADLARLPESVLERIAPSR